jgi:hypothetical protein
MMLDHSSQVQRHSHAERGLDCYSTPSCAITALLRVERIPRRVWEPCAGHGNIVNVLRAAGHEVIASDIADYGIPTHFANRDFLAETKLPAGCECVLTNPPYQVAEQIITHALELSPLVIMLLRLAFLEGGTGRQHKHELRRHVLDEIPPARIHVFDRRLPMLHRDGWRGRKANSGMAFSWWVWKRGHTGPTVIDRISWWR